MAQGLTDDQLQQLVESFKAKRKEKNPVTAAKEQMEKIFVNRSVSMDRIKYVGFDMDHTLVVYKSPAYEQLAFDLAIKRLVSIGYPQEISSISYDPTFPLRGLFFDKVYGNLLKADQFGNILSCFHGFKSLSSSQIRQYYPNKYVQPLDDRIFILYTLYNLAEVYLLASLVDHFDHAKGYKRVSCDGKSRHPDGVQCGDVTITYQMIWQDIRDTIDWIHHYGGVKERTIEDMEKYVKRDPRVPEMLDKFRASGRKTFVATNSGFSYTRDILTYMLEDGSGSRNWKSYFDHIIVDAKKPLFFAQGTMLREVDEETGSLKVGMFTGALQPGKVFSGGSSDAFCKYTGAQGKEILYVGDHIFGDVIKAKKEQAWRTFLVLPELNDEVGVWESCKSLYRRLQNLEFILAESYTHGQTMSSVPDIDSLRKAIKDTAQEMENSYPSVLGSLLRCGSRQTHFAFQAGRFADLYSSACVNLLNYPDTFLFAAPHQLMPHENGSAGAADEEVFLPSAPLSPELSEKIKAKNSSKRKIRKSHLARGMSVIDSDLDEETEESISNGETHDTSDDTNV